MCAWDGKALLRVEGGFWWNAVWGAVVEHVARCESVVNDRPRCPPPKPSLSIKCSARKALEPPDRHMDPVGLEEPWSTPRSALHRESPSLWPQVRAGCLEAILGLAIYAKQHAEVWEAAAVLLRDHPAELSPHRQQSLLENMLAAAAQMAPAER